MHPCLRVSYFVFGTIPPSKFENFDTSLYTREAWVGALLHKLVGAHSGYREHPLNTSSEVTFGDFNARATPETKFWKCSIAERTKPSASARRDLRRSLCDFS